MSKLKSAVASLVCASLIVPVLPLSAVTAAPLPKPGISADNAIILVDRRGRGRWHRGRRGPGPGAIIGAIIAGTLIAAAIREGRAEERDLRRCEEDFYDFDRRTGTYINRYGEERVCPYLR